MGDIPSQIKWLDSVLASALEFGLSVIIATHFPPDNRVKISCGFTASIKEYLGVGKNGAMYEQIQNIVQQFIDKGGNLFVIFLVILLLITYGIIRTIHSSCV